MRYFKDQARNTQAKRLNIKEWLRMLATNLGTVEYAALVAAAKKYYR